MPPSKYHVSKVSITVILIKILLLFYYKKFRFLLICFLNHCNRLSANITQGQWWRRTHVWGMPPCKDVLFVCPLSGVAISHLYGNFLNKYEQIPVLTERKPLINFINQPAEPGSLYYLICTRVSTKNTQKTEL